MQNRYFNATEDNADFLFANISVKNIYFALISLDYILNPPDFDYGIYHDEHTFYFFYLQSLLTACGNISNVFYNPGGRYGKLATERSRRLRQTLNISRPEFQLVFQKEFRNTNEHFDERYDALRGCLGDYNIIDNDTDPYIRSAIQVNPHLRTFDKENMIYITYNQKFIEITYDLNQLRNELKKMLTRITENPVYNSAWVDTMPGEEMK